MITQLPPLSPEEIEQNWKKVLSLLEKLGDRSAVAIAMVEALGERLALCPASAKRDYHRATPGGLVDHSLRVLGNATRLAGVFGWKIPKDSLIISALFHDIGKVGFAADDDSIIDYYVPQTDNWRVEKLGEEYTYNKNMQYMTTPQRSVHMCQRFGLKLKSDEYLSIMLNDGFVVDENKPYCLKIEPLVFAIMTADYISTMQEKGMGKWAEQS